MANASSASRFARRNIFLLSRLCLVRYHPAQHVGQRHKLLIVGMPLPPLRPSAKSPVLGNVKARRPAVENDLLPVHFGGGDNVCELVCGSHDRHTHKSGPSLRQDFTEVSHHSSSPIL